MASTLPLLLASLLTATPSAAPTGKPPTTNSERAKAGLLPRRVAPSHVTDLEGGRSRSEHRDFPEPAAPPTVIESSAADSPAGNDAAAAPAVAAVPAAEPIAAAPAAVAPAAAAPPAAAAAVAAQPAAEAVAAAPAAVAPPPAAAAPAVAAAPAAVAPPAAAPPAAAPAPAVAAAPAAVAPAAAASPAAAAAVAAQPAAEPIAAAPALAARAWVAPGPAARAVAGPKPSDDEEPAATWTVRPLTFPGQRWVDRYGRIIVRVYGPRREILAEHVTGRIDDLPVRWAARTVQGYIVQIVEDPWGPIEVRRDPVGRFVAAQVMVPRSVE